MITGGLEFSSLALSLLYWSWMEPVGKVSLRVGDWDFLA